MKSCNEMVNSLLARRLQYEKEKQNKRKVLLRTAVPVGCICLAMLLGFFAWQGGRFDPQPPSTVNDAIYPGIKDWFDELNGESPDDPAANNITIFNPADPMLATQMSIALLLEDFVEMSEAELQAYYGVPIAPAVPEDLRDPGKTALGLYRRYGGTGEVYWDQNTLNYQNGDLSRWVTVTVGGELPSYPVPDFRNAAMKKSCINNWEVLIAADGKGIYYAHFMYCNISFYVSAQGLSQEEFTGVLSSMLQKV